MDKSYSKRRKQTLLFSLLIMSVAIDLGSLIHNLPSELKKEVRDLEKVSIRRCKTDCSLLINYIHIQNQSDLCCFYIFLDIQFQSTGYL